MPRFYKIFKDDLGLVAGVGLAADKPKPRL